jgi:hypothetical protein
MKKKALLSGRNSMSRTVMKGSKRMLKPFGCQWHMPVILATWEAEIRRITV